MNTRKTTEDAVVTVTAVQTCALPIFPIFIVFRNSFKNRLYISSAPFAWPTGEMSAGFSNYINGLSTSGFLKAFGRSLFVTIVSVVLIIICTAMTSWFITMVKDKFTKGLYYLFTFSMIVPFQMVMYTMTYIVNLIGFNNITGITLVYLGFGAGPSVFMFVGFMKSIPSDLVEASEIDGCNPLQTFFQIIFPVLKPTAITVAILNTMWIWNDYLLPYLVLGTDSKTVPVAIQIAMQGAYGAVRSEEHRY